MRLFVDVSRLKLANSLCSFGDPYWYQSWNSPFYKASHRRLRAFMRKFIDEEITPNCHEWDNQRQIPQKVFKRFAELGLLASLVSNTWPSDYAEGIAVPAGVKAEEWDAFHFMVVLDEIVGGERINRVSSRADMQPPCSADAAQAVLSGALLAVLALDCRLSFISAVRR